MKYRVVFSPEGGKWNVVVPSVKDCHTWGRSLSEARRNARDVIVTCAMRDGLDSDRVEREMEIVEELELPARASQRLEAAREARATLEEAERVSADTTAAAVGALTGVGLSVRDVGDLLGLSFQRIQQLKSAPETTVRKATAKGPVRERKRA